MGAPQGVHGNLKLVHSATPALHVGTEAYELTATFRQSTGDPMYELWAVARYGRVVFVLHGFWFSGGTPINPEPILAKVIARTPSR